MKRKFNILTGALLLVSGCCFQSCQEEEFVPSVPDRDSLITRGMYLAAGDAVSSIASDTEEPKPFETGTPYRLLAFTKPYDGDDKNNTANTVNHPRFNKVAWEGALSGGLHYINIDSEPEKWFGFAALPGETGKTDNLVSLDFYGFTYGIANGTHSSGYIPIDGLAGETTPGEGSLPKLKHTESVSEAGELRDLRHGVLLNQNIATAGTSTADDGTPVTNAYMQSVIPFSHSFSKIRIQVSQQGDEENPEDGNPSLTFKDLYLENIEITGTYKTGAVYLQDGKIDVSEKIDRQMKFYSTFKKEVTEKNTDVGEMIIFPSDGDALKNQEFADGYDVGMRITIKSKVRDDIYNMLHNTGSVDAATGKPEITEEDVDGTKWYYGTIEKDRILNFYSDTPSTLHFKQNTSYMLIIAFQKNDVRIITVIPQVEEWLPGEGTADDPWQNQAMGQPQMFDNVVWSDRNLGADDYDPMNDFELTVGYFYQAGRNIPYFPFDTRQYNHKTTANGNEFTGGPVPSAADKRKRSIAGESSYYHTVYRLYPMVDDRLLNMARQIDSPVSDGSQSSWLWSMSIKYEKPQMFIPETKPSDKDFGFMRGNAKGGNDGTGLTVDQDMKWNERQQNQPVSGSWAVPSSKDFMSIFPSTPFAGNITFRHCSSSDNLMDWNAGGEMDRSLKTLRVTVPYYKKDMAEPSGKSKKYIDAWNTLKNNGDAGTTQEWAYWGKPNSYTAEPDGDPEDGYASVYVISRAEGDVQYLPDELKNLKNGDQKPLYTTTEWGTIYAIKRAYTPQAYRLRLQVLANPAVLGQAPSLYIEICRYRCNDDDTLDETNYKDYDWDHPAARLYFPICGLGDWTGAYINFGTECQYATSDPIEYENTNGTKIGKTSAVQIKITGDNDHNQYISVVKGQINRNFGMQIRPIYNTGIERW